jgi:hypothetical protein
MTDIRIETRTPNPPQLWTCLNIMCKVFFFDAQAGVCPRCGDLAKFEVEHLRYVLREGR